MFMRRGGSRGVLHYWVPDGKDRLKKIMLTLAGGGDERTLAREGLSALRRERLLRLAREAEEQGSPLSYNDLSDLLLCSLATLKRDIGLLKKQGIDVPLRKKKIGSLKHRPLLLIVFLFSLFLPLAAHAEENTNGSQFKRENYTLLVPKIEDPYKGYGNLSGLIAPDGDPEEDPQEIDPEDIPYGYKYALRDYEGEFYYPYRPWNSDRVLEPSLYEYSVSGRSLYYSGQDYSYLAGGLTLEYIPKAYSAPLIFLDIEKGKFSDKKFDSEVNAVDLHYYYAWRRAMLWGNLYYFSRDEEESYGLREVGFYFTDTYKDYFRYYLAVMAGLEKKERKSSWRITGEGGILREKEIPITGTEKAWYAAELKIKHEEGDPITRKNKDSISGTLRGQLSSTRPPKLHLRLFGSAGFNEFGYPVSAGFGVQTRDFKKLFLGAQYTASTLLPKEDEAREFLDHSWNFNLGYKLLPNLELRGFYNYFARDREGPYDFKKKTYEGAILFRPVPTNYIELRAMLEDYSHGETLRLKGIMKQAITKRSGLALDAMHLHNSWNDYTQRQYGMDLYRESRDKKTRLGLDYRIRLSEWPTGGVIGGNEEHRLMGTVTRRF